MGNDALGEIVLAQIGSLIDAPALPAWDVICKKDTAWTTIPVDFRQTNKCKEY